MSPMLIPNRYVRRDIMTPNIVLSIYHSRIHCLLQINETEFYSLAVSWINKITRKMSPTRLIW